MNLIFATDLRYPTEKAYGVTIGESARAARNVYSKVEIWSAAAQSERDEFENDVINIFGNFSPIETFFYKNIARLLPRIAFYLRKLLFTIVIILKLRTESKNCVFWTRNRICALTVSILFKNLKVILEEHYFVNRLKRVILNLFIKSNNSFLGVLTIQHQKNLRMQNKRIFILPMAAPSNFFSEIHEEFFVNKNVLKLGYIGSKASSGFDSGVEDFIRTLKGCNLSRTVEVHLVGIAPFLIDEHRLFNESQIGNNLQIFFYPKVSHREIPEFSAKFDVGFVPYFENDYNSARFPIKIVEYAAMGKILLLSNTSGHRNLVTESEAFFYELKNTQSLCMQLKLIIENEKLVLSKRKIAQCWALTFTYDERIERVNKVTFFAGE